MQNLLITNRSNIRYLSNFTGSTGFMLITKGKKYLFTDFRYIERAKNSIKRGIQIVDTTKMWKNPELLQTNWQSILKKHRIQTLGVEEDDLTMTKYKKFKKISRIKTRKKQTKFADCSGKIQKKREIKKKIELEYIAKSQKINEKVFKKIKKIIIEHLKSPKKTKIREIDLAWKIKQLANEFGAEDVAFDPIVAFGKHSAIPHHQPDKTPLKKGDIVLIDMGVKYQGYCSDMTRTFFTQSPTKKQKEIYNIVLRAQVNGIKNIKSGISGQKADQFSRKIIEEAGYADYYGHGGGHGLGLDIHETPSLSENYLKKLKINSVITIEPGIYLPNEFGVRIEDMVIVQKNGVKNLTKIPK